MSAMSEKATITVKEINSRFSWQLGINYSQQKLFQAITPNIPIPATAFAENADG